MGKSQALFCNAYRSGGTGNAGHIQITMYAKRGDERRLATAAWYVLVGEDSKRGVEAQ